MMNRFIIHTYDYGNSYREEGEYAAWGENKEIVINDIYGVSDEGSYQDVTLFPGEVEPNVNDFVYVVIVRYTTGNSFGNSSGNVEFIWAFTNPTKAQELKTLIENDYEENPDFTSEPLMFYDAPLSTYTWKGYFEALEYVEVIGLPLKKETN